MALPDALNQRPAARDKGGDWVLSHIAMMTNSAATYHTLRPTISCGVLWHSFT